MDTMLSYYTISLQKVYKFAYLQLLWLIFTAFGFGLFGVFPATYALFNILNVEEDLTAQKTFRLFYEAYVSSFVTINKAGLIWQMMILLMGANLLLTRSSLLQLFVIAMIYFMLLCIVHFFRYFMQDQRVVEQIKFSFHYVLLYPRENFLYTIVFLGLFLGIRFLPGIIFFFGASVAAYFIKKTWEK